MQALIITIALAPLMGSLLSGFVAPRVGRWLAHWAAAGSVGLSFIASVIVAVWIMSEDITLNFDWYVWADIEDIRLSIGFLIDNLTVTMMLTVTFVSLMVHIYTIGYMAEDDGYCRFFAYISLFTFAMLMLVMANGFLQLFFGWEAVGLISYLLIGFWFKRPSAISANLKAFLVNRVGDFGFLLGIGLVLAAFGSLDYATVFERLDADGTFQLASLPPEWDAITIMCLLLFVGAMGKSAQFPLHVWLPDSMEGPTPISALIHAATMVTAGIFMVARLSPLFEQSDMALSVILTIGIITAFSMGLLGLVQNDIKRVVAYSTLSQLGYMTAALGASAYSAAIFHLFTHAFFKALLFLAAGSVIIAMHHEQDMRKMGGLHKKMPITHATALLGTLALVGLPPLSGFFSKDMIIEAVGESTNHGISYWLLVGGAFITALYSFRLLILVFYGKQRSPHAVHESAAVVTLPLALLAVPSVVVGGLLADIMLFEGFFSFASDESDLSALGMLLHAPLNPALWAVIAGMVVAFYLYRGYPYRTQALARGPIYRLLLNKYGLDDFNAWFFAGGLRCAGQICWRYIDVQIIDGLVNAVAFVARRLAMLVRRLQTGRIYHYAFTMLLAVVAVSLWWIGLPGQ